MRINKFVARATGMARRKVDDLIGAGQITVNGQPARIGQTVSEEDSVELAGRKLNLPVYTYLMFHKPVGVLSSRAAQRGVKTVFDVLPSSYRHLKLVGRLDKETSGLIILTDDGDFAHSLLHPSNNKSKIYEVELDKPLSDHAVASIKSGVLLEDGKSYMGLLENSGKKVTIDLKEGRNRQIRRTFAALGYEVVKLHRTSIGEYKLNNLEASEFLELDI